jgi:DNA-directed RNA polymerase subunit RPC12/RpoP/outer membrane protein assembly factor BamB
MTEAFDCPNCGAPIQLGADLPATVRCPHCRSTVIVPENLRRRPQAPPVVIQIDAGGGAPTVPPRVGRAVAIGIAIVAVVVLITVAISVVGLVVGIGAAVAPVALPALISDGPPPPLLSFGGEGIGPGLFTDARSVGVDADGRIYVGEYQGGRIQVFDADGEFLTQWFADQEFPLTGMAVRRDGAVYTIQRGEIVLRDGMTGERIGGVAYDGGQHFEDVALLADGGLVTGWYRSQDDLVVFDRDGELVLTIPEAVSGQTGDSELSLRVAADGRGDLLALGEFNDAVFRYDSGGRFLNRFGSQGDEPGQLSAPLSIAVDGQGRVYVGDIWGVEVFERDGRFLERIDVEGVPFGITFDDEGCLWAVNGTKVLKYEVDFE